MNFAVTWTANAENRLANLWIGSRIASQITKVADHLDRILAVNPTDIGESREGSLRIAFQAPLAINYFVEEFPQRVVIVDVWLI